MPARKSTGRFSAQNGDCFRKTLALLGGQCCRTPEEYKAWSQNLGHEQVLTTFAAMVMLAATGSRKSCGHLPVRLLMLQNIPRGRRPVAGREDKTRESGLALAASDRIVDRVGGARGNEHPTGRFRRGARAAVARRGCRRSGTGPHNGPSFVDRGRCSGRADRSPVGC
jgi:hypothetical protein